MFKINLIMFRLHLDVFIDLYALPNQNNNEIGQKPNFVIQWQVSVQRHLATISSGEFRQIMNVQEKKFQNKFC